MKCEEGHMLRNDMNTKSTPFFKIEGKTLDKPLNFGQAESEIKWSNYFFSYLERRMCFRRN
jgi:hypothetical protein